MQATVPDVLGRIVERKQEEVNALRSRLSKLEVRAEDGVRRRRPFVRALRASKPAVIAEIKRASPSKGVLTEDFDPARIAEAYESGGAAALSVLTDREFFQGSCGDLEIARSRVRLPVLRKDFILDEAQIVEAAAHGADAILLITAILNCSELRRFREFAAQFLIASLVEVHDEEELTRALDSGAAVVGVNNRDLHTFQVRLETSLALAERIPKNVLAVSESGIESAEHVRTLGNAGFRAFLVGEHLIRSTNPAQALRDLRCL